MPENRLLHLIGALFSVGGVILLSTLLLRGCISQARFDSFSHEMSERTKQVQAATSTLLTDTGIVKANTSDLLSDTTILKDGLKDLNTSTSTLLTDIGIVKANTSDLLSDTTILKDGLKDLNICLLYTSPSPRD